ncbi:MAG: DUF3107 domain-containing protein [Candidatus Nanopelagicales bacterium]
MEVKIGVLHTAREIVFDSPLTAEEVSTAVQASLTNDSVLNMTDDRGRTILVPADRIAYVELGVPATRRVGFGSTA